MLCILLAADAEYCDVALCWTQTELSIAQCWILLNLSAPTGDLEAWTGLSYLGSPHRVERWMHMRKGITNFDDIVAILKRDVMSKKSTACWIRYEWVKVPTKFSNQYPFWPFWNLSISDVHIQSIIVFWGEDEGNLFMQHNAPVQVTTNLLQKPPTWNPLPPTILASNILLGVIATVLLYRVNLSFNYVLFIVKGRSDGSSPPHFSRIFLDVRIEISSHWSYSADWGSVNGRLTLEYLSNLLSTRATFVVFPYSPDRLMVRFQSCFLDTL